MSGVQKASSGVTALFAKWILLGHGLGRGQEFKFPFDVFLVGARKKHTKTF